MDINNINPIAWEFNGIMGHFLWREEMRIRINWYNDVLSLYDEERHWKEQAVCEQRARQTYVQTRLQP